MSFYTQNTAPIVGWVESVNQLPWVPWQDLERDRFERELRDFVRDVRLTLEERARLHADSQRRLYHGGRPALRRQWYRPRAVGRACGSRHRVMLC